MVNEKLVAYNEFQQARRQAWMQQLSSRLGGRDTQLIPFDTIRTQLKQRNPLYRGVQEIPLNQIVGSVGRYHAFDRSFLPLTDNLKERWVNLHSLAQTQGWPPIETYKVGNAYFVKDGNHRVSVAQAIGNSTIEAHVWEYPEDILINPEDSLDQMLIYLGERAFTSVTHLDDLYPNHNIRFTTPGRYTELLAQIEDLQAQLSFIDRAEMPYEEAVIAWYEMVYLPVIQIIQEAKLLENFSGHTEADLFVWLSVYRDRLKEQLGEYETLVDLAHKVAERYKMGTLGKITRHVLRWFGQEAPPPWRVLDETDGTVTIEPETSETEWTIIPDFEREKDVSMLKKSYTQTGNFCKVTFKLPAEINAEMAYLVGEFNNWDNAAHPMKKLKDGSFSLTISLPADKAYRFRYLLDENRWENDWAADAYVPNEHGSDDSLVKI